MALREISAGKCQRHIIVEELHNAVYPLVTEGAVLQSILNSLKTATGCPEDCQECRERLSQVRQQLRGQTLVNMP